MSKSSWELGVPIVFSVPNKIKCLSGEDIKLSREAVGALATAVALVPVPLEVSQI